MRSTDVPRQLECHAFVCTSPEDAIVIAATLYQSLMTHMNSSQTRKSRKPRNQNGVSCISIASSSVTNLQQGIAAVSGCAAAAAGVGGSVTSAQLSNRALELLRHRQSSFRNPSRPPRKKRSSTGSGSVSGHSDFMSEAFQQACSSTEERKKKSHKTRRAPPIPGPAVATGSGSEGEFVIL